MLFPSYRESTYPQRTLVFYEDHKLVWSNGATRAIDSFSDFYSIVFRENLQVLIDRIIHFPWLYDLMQAGEVLCDKKKGPRTAILKGAKHAQRTIVQAASWGYRHVSRNLLKELVDIFRACGVGTRSTPASLGQAKMRELFPYSALRHGEPRADAQRALREHSCGGRAQLFRVSEKIDCIVLDERNGYARQIKHWGLPTGTTYTITAGGVSTKYAAWFCECNIIQREWLPLAPYGLREGDAPIQYPVAPGIYHGWLWDFQYESCIEAGLDVTIGRGFAWRELSHDLDGWVEQCCSLRNEHPLMKRAIVQGPGRFNMEPVRHILVLWPESDDDINVIDDYGQRYQLWIHSKPDRRVWQGPHWFSYYTNRQADETYRKIVEIGPEHVIACNIDAVYCDKDTPGIEAYNPEESQTGKWRCSLYKTADLLKNRWFRGYDTDGNLRLNTPGQPHDAHCECEKCLVEAA